MTVTSQHSAPPLWMYEKTILNGHTSVTDMINSRVRSGYKRYYLNVGPDIGPSDDFPLYECPYDELKNDIIRAHDLKDDANYLHCLYSATISLKVISEAHPVTIKAVFSCKALSAGEELTCTLSDTYALTDSEGNRDEHGQRRLRVLCLACSVDEDDFGKLDGAQCVVYEGQYNNVHPSAGLRYHDAERSRVYLCASRSVTGKLLDGDKHYLSSAMTESRQALRELSATFEGLDLLEMMSGLTKVHVGLGYHVELEEDCLIDCNYPNNLFASEGRQQHITNITQRLRVASDPHKFNALFMESMGDIEQEIDNLTERMGEEFTARLRANLVRVMLMTVRRCKLAEGVALYVFTYYLCAAFKDMQATLD